MYPWALKTLLDKTSLHTFRERVVTLRKSGCHFGKAHDRFVRIVGVGKTSRCVAMNPQTPRVHSVSFMPPSLKKVFLHLPLSIFEKELLTELNVAPAQPHSNRWPFIHSFTILCSRLDISPTVELFLYFF